MRNSVEFLKMIKFSHSIFALPFALSSYCIACMQYSFSLKKLLWIIIAMISARSSAMGFNRLVDKNHDTLNPRTKNRILPNKKITPNITICFITFFCCLFIVSSLQLNFLCFILSPFALFIILFYSYTKRFTSLSHWILGVSLALAPMGSWLAVTGSFNITPVILSLGVLFWISGFDLIYACQDIAFDKKHKLFSIPSRYSIKMTFFLAICSSFLSLTMFITTGLINHFNQFYYLGIIIIGLIFIYQYIIIDISQFPKIKPAFFTVNLFISIIFFMATILGML